MPLRPPRCAMCAAAAAVVEVVTEDGVVHARACIRCGERMRRVLELYEAIHARPRAAAP